jgi:hypothetical protein
MVGSSSVEPSAILSFKNTSSRNIAFTLEESLDWLNIQNATGTVAAGKTARVTLKATCSSIAKLSGQINLVYEKQSKAVKVQLSCASTAPGISTPTPSIITLSGNLGKRFTASFSFDSTGDEDLTYSIEEDEDWLEIITNQQGTLAPENSVTVALQLTCPEVEGDYTTTVLVNSNASDRVVDVSLTCSATPLPGISAPNPDTIALAGGIGDSLTTSFSFDSTGEINLIYSIRENVDWLTVTSNQNGTLAPDQSVTVVLRATCPASKTELATTVVIDSNAPDQIVNISLSCSGDPILGDISPDPLTLEGQTTQSTSSSFTLQNIGGADLTFAISSNQSWLTATPTSGTIEAASTQIINVSAICGTLQEERNATLTITSNDTSKPSVSLEVTLTCSSDIVSAFSIQLQYIGTFSATQRNAIETAAARWSEVIVGDLPNRSLSKAFNICGIQDPEINGVIDDVMIGITIGPIDGEGKIFADAGPCALREVLPLYSTIKFDSADIASFASDLEEVMLREIGFALGFGSLWEKLDKVTYSPDTTACNTRTSFSTRPTFNGATAKTRFNALGGAGSPPAEDGINAEVRCSSWDEQVFDNELMTSIFDKGANNLLSLLTIAAMQDIGYETDPSKADPYELPECSPSCPQNLVGGYESLRKPIGK